MIFNTLKAIAFHASKLGVYKKYYTLCLTFTVGVQLAGATSEARALVWVNALKVIAFHVSKLGAYKKYYTQCLTFTVGVQLAGATSEARNNYLYKLIY